MEDAPKPKNRKGLHKNEILQHLRDTYPHSGGPLRVRYLEAMIIQIREGLTNKEMADRLGVVTQTFQNKKSCKEGQAFIKEVKKLLSDPKSLCDRIFRDEAVFTAGHLIDMRDGMHRMGNYEGAAKIDLKILELNGYFQKNQFDVKVETLQITIKGSSKEDLLRSPSDLVEAEYTVIDSGTTLLPTG